MSAASQLRQLECPSLGRERSLAYLDHSRWGNGDAIQNRYLISADARGFLPRFVGCTRYPSRFNINLPRMELIKHAKADIIGAIIYGRRLRHRRLAMLLLCDAGEEAFRRPGQQFKFGLFGFRE